MTKLSLLIEKFEIDIKNKYNQIDKFGIYHDSSINALYLSDLYIKNDFKDKGIGTKIILDVISFSDKLQLPLVLIPDSDNDQQRLINFYKKFGFVVNSGKNINHSVKIPHSVSMYRMPM